MKINPVWCKRGLIRLHERHATLTDYRDKITMPRASDSYEGLPGVCGEQGNKVIFTMGTRELSKKIMGNKGT